MKCIAAKTCSGIELFCTERGSKFKPRPVCRLRIYIMTDLFLCG